MQQSYTLAVGVCAHQRGHASSSGWYEKHEPDNMLMGPSNALVCVAQARKLWAAAPGQLRHMGFACHLATDAAGQAP